MSNTILTDEDKQLLITKHAPPIHPDYADKDDFEELIDEVEKLVIAKLAAVRVQETAK